MHKKKKSFYAQAHRIAYLTLVVFFFLVAYPLLWYFGRNPRKHFTELVEIRCWIAKYAARFAGFKFSIEAETSVDWSKNYIICANHTSNLDITAIMLAFDAPFVFIGKEELLSNPITGFFFKRIDIPINRESKVSSFRAFKKCKEELIYGNSVAIFPEGGISDEYPPQLGEFKIGAFKLALDTQTSILPVVIHDTWKKCWDDGSVYGTTPGKIHISILSPIDSSACNSAEDLQQKVHQNMKNRLLYEN